VTVGIPRAHVSLIQSDFGCIHHGSFEVVIVNGTQLTPISR
jgi:hypothetical protein